MSSIIDNVSALFVDPHGPYPGMVVDWWDEKRDARKYMGPNPVVAHPPCQLWGPFTANNFKRWGGEHNRPGNDGGCFASALSSVTRHDGVLEHPAGTRAWKAFSIRKPIGIGWQRIGRAEWVCEVWQTAYGHRAQKRTWLFYSSHLEREPLPASWERLPGTHQCGYHDQRGKARNKPTLGKKEASATPLAFAEYLVALALHSISARETQ